MEARVRLIVEDLYLMKMAGDDDDDDDENSDDDDIGGVKSRCSPLTGVRQ